MIHYRKIVLLGLFASFAFVFIPHITNNSELLASFTATRLEAAPLITPTHLTILTAKVNATVIPVGVTKEGKLDVPPNYTQVGWYKYGTLPGEMGSAVLDGHVDDARSTPGPFKYLRDAKMGDDISITMSDGRVLHYTITASEVYDIEKFPGEKVFHETGKQYLKIITCHGKYVSAIKTYNQRLIVTAVRNP